jgi:hypothetical protein
MSYSKNLMRAQLLLENEVEVPPVICSTTF